MSSNRISLILVGRDAVEPAVRSPDGSTESRPTKANVFHCVNSESQLAKGCIRLDKIAVWRVHDVRQSTQFKSSMRQKFVRVPEKPGARVKLLEKDFRVDDLHSIEHLSAAAEDEAFRALQVELKQIHGLQSF